MESLCFVFLINWGDLSLVVKLLLLLLLYFLLVFHL